MLSSLLELCKKASQKMMASNNNKGQAIFSTSNLIQNTYHVKYQPYNIRAFRGGKAFPPHPHFCPVPGFHFPWVAPLLPRRPLWGLTCRPVAANSSPPAVGGLWQRAFASLRSTASLLLLAARFGFAEPCGSLTSAARRLPRF